MTCLCWVGSARAFGWVFLFFTGFSCFVLLFFYPFAWGFLGSVFVPGCASFEPLGNSFVSQAFFFASLLLCFFASLLCFYLLIAFLILCVVLYRFYISYLSLLDFHVFSSLLILFLKCGECKGELF